MAGRRGAGETIRFGYALMLVAALFNLGMAEYDATFVFMPLDAARAFARALGRALHRPALLPVPGPLLRLGLGELSGLLLGGQKALPQRALADGYVFRFTDLDSALADLLKDSA